MRIISHLLVLILLTVPAALRADGANCEITAHCYSMSVKDATEFTLQYNPAGQAIQSWEKLQEWVEKKKAVSMGALFTVGRSGLLLQANRDAFAMRTETVVSRDATYVDVVFKITFSGQ